MLKKDFIKYFENYSPKNCLEFEFTKRIDVLYKRWINSVLEAAISAIIKSHDYKEKSTAFKQNVKSASYQNNPKLPFQNM